MSRNPDGPELPLRKRGLSIRALHGESIVYDPETQRASCVNDFAAAVLERCDGAHAPAEIARDLPFATVDERVVALALADLRKAGLLEAGPAVEAAALAGTSRRDFIRRIGLGTAIAVPVVNSVVLPSAAQTVSCSGDCASDNECPRGCRCDLSEPGEPRSDTCVPNDMFPF